MKLMAKERESYDSGGKGRGSRGPFQTDGGIPGLIQRYQNGSEGTVVRGPSSPGSYRLLV